MLNGAWHEGVSVHPVRPAARDFFDLLAKVREERGLSYKQLARKTGIDRATLHRWFTKRVTLPSWDEVRPVVAALDPHHEAEWLHRWRQAAQHDRQGRLGPELPASGTGGIAADVPANATAMNKQGGARSHPNSPPADQDSTPPPAPATVRPPAPTAPPGPASRSRTRRRLLVTAGSALLLVAGGCLYWVTERRTGATVDAAAPTPDVFSSPVPQTYSDTAWSSDRAAHAQFRPREKLFYLYDDRTDGRSAVLVISAEGLRIGPIYNSAGKTGRLKKGRPIPPLPVEVSTLDLRTKIDFRVCAGERGKPLALNSCGTWTRVPTD